MFSVFLKWLSFLAYNYVCIKKKKPLFWKEFFLPRVLNS
jgi:hypothetical protein